MTKAEEYLEDGEKCPKCGGKLPEAFDMGDIHIDTQTGFVALKSTCCNEVAAPLAEQMRTGKKKRRCGTTVTRFYDYDRTELEES